MPSISVTFLIFHLEISGNDTKEEHSKNKSVIHFTFEVSQEEISGKYFNDLHEANKELIFVILNVFILDMFDKDNKDEQFENILLIFVIFCIPFNLISKVSSIFNSVLLISRKRWSSNSFPR